MRSINDYYRTLGAEDKDLILTDSEKADSTVGAEAAAEKAAAEAKNEKQE